MTTSVSFVFEDNTISVISNAPDDKQTFVMQLVLVTAASHLKNHPSNCDCRACVNISKAVALLTGQDIFPTPMENLH